MNEHFEVPKATKASLASMLFGVIGLASAGCASSPVVSGLAVGQLGDNLGEQAQDVPQGGVVCAYQEALAPPSPSGTDKQLSDACKKATNSEAIWKKSMQVLGAYSAKLEAIASGEGAEQAGKVDGAVVGVTDATWGSPDGAAETSARDAIVQLSTQLKQNPTKGDLGDTIKQAAPHVKTLCDGLGSYLDAQIKAAGEAQTEIEKRRGTHNDRRCASMDGKNVCVQESVLDRMTYAGSYGDLSFISANHANARDTLSEFCAAHAKLEEAANSGNLKSDKTYQDILDAIANAPRAGGKSSGGGGESKPAEAKPEAKPGEAKPAEEPKK